VYYGFQAQLQAPKPLAYALCLALSLVTGTLSAGPAALSRAEILGTEIENNPGEQALYLRRALAWADSGRPDRAMADVDHAEKLGDPLRATLVRGILFYRQHAYGKARACFDTYLQRYPDHTGALAYRARLLRATGDKSGALADYQHLIRLQPEQDPGIYVVTAQLTSTNTNNGIPAALALLDQRMKTVGAIPQLQRYAIALEQQQGDYPAALQRLSTLDDSIRATQEWHVEAAELLLAGGDPTQARAHLRVASEQLQQLRVTPARIKTGERTQALLGQLDGETQ
jgi:tetratricopeptide (TPR) repeat protein